jgi:hypothetical protein
MSWAGRRKALIITVGAIVLLAALAVFSFGIFYDTPTCTDRRQNQDEAGVDCGGSCSRMCSFEVKTAPVVLWTQVVEPEEGRADVIAYVENRNTDAASRKTPFRLEVYDASGGQISEKSVTVDLPPRTTVPVYIPNAAPRDSRAVRAFLTYDSEKAVWTKASDEERIEPSIEDVVIQEGAEPRITAKLVNSLAEPMRSITLIATLFDPSGNAMAASQTVVPTLPAQGSSQVVFTWRQPFPAPAARVEIRPVPTLSRAP